MKEQNRNDPTLMLRFGQTTKTMIEIQSLNDVLKHVDRKKIKRIFGTFKCAKNEDIEKFLSDFAIAYEENDICHSFLVMNTDYPLEI